jgi:ribosome-associated translation inhibitor RaiA
MFVQINTDNQIKTDADANDLLEKQIRTKLKRFDSRLTHVELHVADVNGDKKGLDKRVSLAVRANGHGPIAVHAEATKVSVAVTAAANKVVRALDHALCKLKDSKGH